MKLCNLENELLCDWVNELKYRKGKYFEPVLRQETIYLIKLACTTFNQDIHVFIMSVDSLEDYIHIKNVKNEEITQDVVIIATIVFLASKYMGEQDLKVQNIDKFLTKITGKEYGSSIIRKTEMEVLKTLGNKLPVVTIADDLNTFVTQYEREFKIKVSVQPLCLDILEALYLTKDKWFFELKTVYIQSDETLNVFKSLMSSRFYLPIGILLYAFLHTNYENFISVENIIEDISDSMHVHADHISLLISKIHEVVKLE